MLSVRTFKRSCNNLRPVGAQLVIAELMQLCTAADDDDDDDDDAVMWAADVGDM